jgi:hypothetical protein
MDDDVSFRFRTFVMKLEPPEMVEGPAPQIFWGVPSIRVEVQEVRLESQIKATARERFAMTASAAMTPRTGTAPLGVNRFWVVPRDDVIVTGSHPHPPRREELESTDTDVARLATPTYFGIY